MGRRKSPRVVVFLSGMTVPAARRDPRLRRYPLRRLRLPMAGGNLSIVVPGTDDWLHTGGWADAVDRGAEPPYWADVWPAAVAVARWLGRQGDLVGASVLDLGCGLGVPGAAAARGGAAVTFADLHRDALAFATFNARQQGAAPERIVAVEHDWHGEALPGPFDLICLADVSYRPVHHPALLRQVRRGLAEGGVAVHADPFRRESDDFLRQVGREFAVRQSTLATHFGAARQPIRLTLVGRHEAVFARWTRGPGNLGDESAAGPATEAR